MKVKMKSTRGQKSSIKVKLEKVHSVAPIKEEVKKKTKHPYQMYTQEDLIAAVKAVKEGGMSTYKAAELYGIPKSTVHDKASAMKGSFSYFLQSYQISEMIYLLIK